MTVAMTTALFDFDPSRTFGDVVTIETYRDTVFARYFACPTGGVSAVAEVIEFGKDGGVWGVQLCDG